MDILVSHTVPDTPFHTPRLPHSVPHRPTHTVSHTAAHTHSLASHPPVSLSVRATLQLYSGNYDTYLRTRADNETNQMKQYEKEQDDIKHLKAFISSCGTYSNLVKQAQSKQKIIDKMVSLPLCPLHAALQPPAAAPACPLLSPSLPSLPTRPMAPPPPSTPSAPPPNISNAPPSCRTPGGGWSDSEGDPRPGLPLHIPVFREDPAARDGLPERLLRLLGQEGCVYYYYYYTTRLD